MRSPPPASVAKIPARVRRVAPPAGRVGEHRAATTGGQLAPPKHREREGRQPERAFACLGRGRATLPSVPCAPKRPGNVVVARYRDDVDIARTLTAAVAKDDGWYVARCLEVEVASQGETVYEALANLREALELYFEDDEVPATFDHPLVTPIEIRIPA